MRQRVHVSQFYHTISQQAKGPVALSFKRTATRKGDEMGFGSSIQPAQILSPGRATVQCNFQPLCGETLTYPLYSRATDLHCRRNAFIIQTRPTRALVGLEQDARM